jgi:hypothetical protein
LITPTERGRAWRRARVSTRDGLHVDNGESQPDAVHLVLENRFPVRLVGESAANGRSAAQ